MTKSSSSSSLDERKKERQDGRGQEREMARRILSRTENFVQQRSCDLLVGDVIINDKHAQLLLLRDHSEQRWARGERRGEFRRIPLR
eukprot:768208-Hanusia_phi.AAC.2